MVKPLKLKHRLALRLARYTLVLAFLIGLLLSTLQVVGDYLNQESRIDQTIRQILVVSAPPATRAVNTLDTTLAEEVVNGLLQYPYVISARIKDELDTDLAYSNIEHKPSTTRWITGKISSEHKTYNLELRTPDYVGVGPGHLELVVNMDEALRPFFERSVIVIASGAARNLLLAFLLIVLFYLALTRPLERLSLQFLSVRDNPREVHHLEVAPRHKDNELGLLCDAGNQFIDTVQQLLKDQECASEALKQSEMRLLRLIDQLPQMVVAQNARGDILFSNQQFANFYGQSLENIRQFKLKTVTSAVLEMAHLDSLREKTLKNKAVTYINQLALTNHKGHKQTFSLQVAPFEYFNEPATLMVANDITRQINAQSHIAHLANHDSLTGLPNRVLLSEHLTQALISSRSNKEFNALLFVDLDHFKSINDAQGHALGDAVLKIAAQRLLECVRNNDTVARLGGDEFIILIRSLSQEQQVATRFVSKVCDALLTGLAEPIHLAERTLQVSASVGIVLFPTHSDSRDDLLRFADTAMYRAKSMGRNQAVFFEKSMGDEVERRLALENQLYQALELKQFEIHYQAIHDDNAEIVGYEALVRWHHPEQGLIIPEGFINILESGGLILKLGQWMLKHCCQQLADWQKNGFWQPHWQLSINVGHRQFFSDSFLPQLHLATTLYDIAFEDLCLEISESTIAENWTFAKQRLIQFKALGLKLAVDDFGAEIGSLRYLKDLPLDMVKIDNRVITKLPEDEYEAVVVKGMVDVAVSMQLRVVAEGVETQAQFDRARECGCHNFQGFLLSKPLSLKQLTENSAAFTS